MPNGFYIYIEDNAFMGRSTLGIIPIRYIQSVDLHVSNICIQEFGAKIIFDKMTAMKSLNNIS